jgi:thiamine pyrophosphate-dependent acetolactate synthase large subunit-like protein
MGVPGCRVERSEELARALEQRSETPGPFLIEALL